MKKIILISSLVPFFISCLLFIFAQSPFELQKASFFLLLSGTIACFTNFLDPKQSIVQSEPRLKVQKSEESENPEGFYLAA